MPLKRIIVGFSCFILFILLSACSQQDPKKADANALPNVPGTPPAVASKKGMPDGPSSIGEPNALPSGGVTPENARPPKGNNPPPAYNPGPPPPTKPLGNPPIGGGTPQLPKDGVSKI